MNVEFKFKAEIQEDVSGDVMIEMLECLIANMSMSDLLSFWENTDYRSHIIEMVERG